MMKVYTIKIMQTLTVYDDIAADSPEEAKKVAEACYEKDEYEFLGNKAEIDHEISID